jgi:putative hydrolase of HD superfamily
MDFYLSLSNLKKTKRTGWIRNGIQNPESIADHMHRMAMIAWMIKDPNLDRDRLIKMAIIHDVAEAVVGDLTPDDPVSREEKATLERCAMMNFVDILGKTEQANEMLGLWEEYEEGATLEAVVCKDLDKFEMILQAYEYEKEHHIVLQSFFDSTQGRFKHPEVIDLVNQLYQQRSELAFIPQVEKECES